MGNVTGGCLCGEIRYEISAEPKLQALCYCIDCQIVSGAAGYAAYGVPIDSLTLIKGKPAEYNVKSDSGRINSRRFCANCGTRVWAQLEELGMATINGLTLDDREKFQPQAIHYPESAPSWCLVDRNLDLLPPIPRD